MFTMTEVRSRILQHPPNAITEIRKIFNLDNKHRLDEAVNLLQDWIQKHDYFTKKDISRIYLEAALYASKGSVEKAKQRLEKLFTLRTVLPDYFQNENPRNFSHLGHLVLGVLTKYDYEYNRVFVVKFIKGDFSSTAYTNFFKKAVIFCEYLMHHDIMNGIKLVFDLTMIDALDALVGFNLIETRNVLKLIMEGYGLKMRGLHLILSNSTSRSKVYPLLIKLLKTLLVDKLSKRVIIHQSVEEVFKYVPREILPVDYGGNEMSLADLTEKWNEILGSEEVMEEIKEINKAKIDERVKHNSKYYKEYTELTGSFRKLEFD